MIEPQWLEITRHEVFARVSKPLLIAHLTDLHLPIPASLERNLLLVLEQEKPDLIVLTGDSVTDSTDREQLKSFLERLHAPLGVWAVEGNWEHWTGTTNDRKISHSANVTFLTNASRRIREDAWVVGIDDVLAGKPDERKAFEGVPRNDFCVLLTHSPQFFLRTTSRCPLVLAGHTHGGQIRLPFLRPLWTPPGSGAFVAGWYFGNGSRMYVSRGIGTSIIRARLFSRPEVAFFTIRPKDL